MKKGLLVWTLLLLGISLIGCSSKPKLYVLNWGDYMDESLILDFESLYHVEIVYRESASNEDMLTLLLNSKNVYDVVIPSDYMIDKLVSLELLLPIDFAKLDHWDSLTVIPNLNSMYEATDIMGYFVPYAWGTMGIMYQTQIEGLKDLIETEEWAALFEYGMDYRVGMYDSPRDAVASALLYKGHSVNSISPSELQEAEYALIMANIDMWGEDSLKTALVQGDLDMALVYSGDYFSEYYQATENGEDITFDYYTPHNSNAWMDAMVIPKTSDQSDLAHQFINFFLEYQNALQNSSYIGYAPCFVEIYEAMVQDLEFEFALDTFNPYPDDTIRQIYQYGTDDRSEMLEAILARVKAE